MSLRFLVLLWMLVPGVALAESIDFDRDVRPILATRCYHCHGPDEKAREADLRLDRRDSAFEDRGGYAAVVPGNLEKSELLQRVTSDDEFLRMPPPDSKLSLSEAEKQTLRQWILQGATWDRHWAFVNPLRPEVPRVQHDRWPITPIDHFVLKRLETRGLAPSRLADKETLIRRVTLDLTGLPPTPAEVDAFLADDRPDAYERVVDRLLDSPHYGERMAWPWLDAARYADTDGFQGDPTRSMWPWRDWLVDALNDNMPFDEFTIEMLAGDLLPAASPEQILATGFNRNHTYNGEGGRIPEETRVENVFDRTETTATVWLGLTMTCARCHDHKFDPISQAEYYSLYALFNNTSETGRGGTRGQAPPSRRYLSAAQRDQVAQLERQITALEQQMSAPLPEVDARQRAWEAELREQIAAFNSNSAPTQLSNWYQAGPIAAAEHQIDAGTIDQFLSEAVRKKTLPQLPGAGGWRLREDYVDGKVHELPDTVGFTYLTRTIQAASARTLEVSLGSDDGITVWINGDQPLLNKQVARAAEPDQERLQLEVAAGTNQLLLRIENTGGIAGFYFKVVGESVAGLPLELAAVVAKPEETREPQQQTKLTEYYRARFAPHWQQLNQQREQLQQRREQIENAAPVVMIMDTLPEDKRRETRVLEKGIYNKPTDTIVTAATPAALHAPDGPVSNRLDLARWIMSDDNPLTARVTVNRYWQIFFGRGLVTTTEDFGQTGSPPTHPQLLDWLAVEFRENGWDVKQLHKTIVMSATYRQTSSRFDSLGDGQRAIELDPQNTLYWHAPRFRMPSWMLRDQALAVSGLLNEKQGGPPVRPYQPQGIWAEATFGKIRYQPDSGEKLYRRSLYVFWRRIVGPTMFFDAGKRQTCEVKPMRTNTPLHALTTLNETAFVESARHMAQRVLQTDFESDAERLTYAFRLALARTARPEEADVLGQRLTRLQQYYGLPEHADEAVQLLQVGDSPRDTSLDAAEHAAWTVVCSTIMNLDEFLTRE